MIHNHFGGVFKSSNGQRVLNSIAQSVQRRQTQTKKSTPSNAGGNAKTSVIATNKKNSPKPLNQAQKQQHAAMVLQAQRKGQLGTGQYRRAASRKQRQSTNIQPTATRTSQSSARLSTAAKTSRTAMTLQNPALNRVRRAANIPVSKRPIPGRNQKNKNTGGALISTNPSSSVNSRTPSTTVHSTKRN
jgi:hypothetical protein